MEEWLAFRRGSEGLQDSEGHISWKNWMICFISIPDEDGSKPKKNTYFWGGNDEHPYPLANVYKKLWKDPPFSSWVNPLFLWP
jgi:hypothetical protein